MKKIIAFFLSAILIFSGCSKTSNVVNTLKLVPDVTNFLVSALSSFVAGATATVKIASTSLADGTYTIQYNLGSPNFANGLTASINISSGNGSFQTQPLATAGSTSITVVSITNSSGNSSSLSSNNQTTISDSTGLLAATVGSSPFRATDVTASVTGTMLNVRGVVWQPNLSNIDLTIYNYASATGTFAFNSNNFNAAADYGSTGSSGTAETAAHGVITINSVSPLLTGTFSFTNEDSSKVTNGTFSCVAP